MEFNPRKIDRFSYLYDFRMPKFRESNRDFHFHRYTVLFCVLELRWFSLTSEVAESREILGAMEELITAANEDMEVGIMKKKYDYLPFVEVIQKDRGFLKRFRGIYDVKLEKGVDAIESEE